MAQLKYKPVILQEAIVDRFSELGETIQSHSNKIEAQMRLNERLNRRHHWRIAHRRRR